MATLKKAIGSSLESVPQQDQEHQPKSIDCNINSNSLDSSSNLDCSNNSHSQIEKLNIMTPEEDNRSNNNIDNNIDNNNDNNTNNQEVKEEEKSAVGEHKNTKNEKEADDVEVVWTDDISNEIHDLLTLAEELTNIPWKDTSIPSDKMYFENPSKEYFEIMCKQLVSVLLVKLIAVVQENNIEIDEDEDEDDIDRMSMLIITSDVLKELKHYVFIILKHYISVAYHSSEHALHVTLSANKLLSFIVQSPPSEKDSTKISYGIQSSALMQFTFLFSALIHDVEHLGVTNRALMDEEHPLAILYNDQNMLEQQSLTIAFKEFLKADYVHLRNVIFAPDYNTKYLKFRRLVVDLVLCTDIASPERMQLTKSKFREAFGEAIKKRNSVPGSGAGAGKRGSFLAKDSLTTSLDDYGSDNEGWLSLGSYSSDEEDSEVDEDEDDPAAPVFSKEKKLNLLFKTRKVDFSETTSLSSSESDEEDDNDPADLTRLGNINYRPLPSVSRYSSKSVGNLSQLKTSNKYGGTGSGGVSRIGSIGNRHSSLPTNFFQSRTYRLGIRIALDFTGLTVSRFPDEETQDSNKMKKLVSTTTMTPSTNKNEDSKDCQRQQEVLKQEDPLKAQVILELMIRAADIGATMQSFQSFTRWGRRLYFEQKRAFECGRGVDPDSYWLNGQIAFLDSYAKQLAKSMEDSFVFGEENNTFVLLIEENKRMWKELGNGITEETKMNWMKESSEIIRKENTTTAQRNGNK